MAATTSLFIDSYHPKSNGECAVSVRVTFERKKRYYKTDKTVPVDDFNKAMGEKPRGEFKELALVLQAFEKKAADIIEKLPVFTFVAFEKQYFNNRATKHLVYSSFSHYITELKKEDRIGTASTYECAQNSLNKFSSDTRFADITPEFLRKYEKWMLNQGSSITTVGIYLRSLRALFNIAIEDGILAKEFYPFGKRRYEIPTGNNIKKALTLKDIGKLFNFKGTPGSVDEKAKDLWIFMYLCNGINVKDMSLLTYSNIKGDVLEFIRAKTIRTKRKVEPIRVSLTNEIKVIIQKWGNTKKDSDTFIFPILEKGLSPIRQRQLIKQITGVINDHTREIAKRLEIVNDVTTYSARHSFSTVMQRAGVSTEYISEALGHSSVKTTANYLAGFEDDSKREHAKALTAFPNE